MNGIDKIKIFDHFSKKAKITTYEVFRRNNDYKLFGVNVIINGIEWCLEHNSSFLVDFRCKNDISYGYHEYSAKNFPRKFKEAIINTCIKLNESILAQTNAKPSPNSIVFIPQASSLEELAINMDLER